MILFLKTSHFQLAVRDTDDFTASYLYALKERETYSVWILSDCEPLVTAELFVMSCSRKHVSHDIYTTTNIFQQNNNKILWRKCGLVIVRFVLTFTFVFPAQPEKRRPVPGSLRGSLRKVYTSPSVSKPVTVSMSEPQSHHVPALLLCQSSFGPEPESLTHHHLHLLHPMKKLINRLSQWSMSHCLAPPAICKLPTVDWMFSICSTGRSWLTLA